MKEELIGKLELLVKEEISEQVFSKAEEIKNEYLKACENLSHELLDKFVEEGNTASDFVSEKDPLDSRFNELIHILSDRENKFRKIVREEVAARLQTKKDVLAELEKLVASESNIGQAFKQFRELQTKWNEAGNIPKSEYKNLRSVYQRHLHNFYYNIKLSKDLRELDFKRNLEFRISLLSKIESLLNMESIRGVERMLNLYRMEWSELGPTAPEHIEPMRTKYRNVIAQVLKRIRDYYREQQEKELQHLEAKKLLLEQALKLSADDYSNSKAWQKATEAIQNIFDEWKKIGYAPKKDEDKMRNELRTSLNLFYKKKRTHFASLKKTFKENKEKKLALIKEAEAIAIVQYELWEEPTKKVLQLQKDWQTTGHVEQRDESKLWKLFHDCCNKFFEAKRGSFKERDDEQLKNLEVKKDLIKRLKEFAPSANTDEDIKTLKSFSEEWKVVGHVPYKEMDRVYDEYKKILDGKYDTLKMDGSKKHMLKFKNNIDLLSQGGNPDETLRKEKQFIKDKISKLNTTISQYENNLGFFRNSKNMGSLLKDAEENLAKAKEEVELLNKKLKMISDAASAPVVAK